MIMAGGYFKPKLMTGIRFCLLIAGLAGSVSGSRPASAIRQHADTPVSVIAPEPMIQQTSWKAFYNKLPDTLTLNFANDTAAVLSSTGVPVLKSTYKYKNDIVTFHDFGGLNACNDLTGSYHVKINGDTLTLVIDEDPCDARAGMLIIKPWIRK
jgi:hypothetical protein